MTDTFQTFTSGLDSPATSAAAVTASDSTVLDTTRALYVGTTGDVSVVTKDGNTVTFAAVPAGAILPIRVTKVRSTGTTASNIVALW